MDTLADGVKLLWVSADDFYCECGEGRVQSIVVTMETGQSARVPWAKVTFIDGHICLINLALCQQLRLA